jgi:predicted RNA-binding protein YlxR (DUF448 family)
MKINKKKWNNKETIIKEVKNYNTYNEWALDSPSSYRAARRLNLIKFIQNNFLPKSRRDDFDNDFIIKDAQKYNSRVDWIKNSKSTYNAAKKKNILDEACRHMIASREKKKWKDKETIIEEVKNYKTYKEWIYSSPSSYHAAIKFKLLKFIQNSFLPKHYRDDFDNDFIIKDAQKYKSRVDWIRNSQSAYNAARKKNILDEACRHMIALGNLKKRCLYIIGVKNTKIIYVGLTYNFQKRLSSHFLRTKKIKEILQKFGKENIFTEKITDYLNVDVASNLEKIKIQEYKEKGYKVLNTSKGGGIGGNILYWTDDKILKEAEKFNTVKEWLSKSPKSYDAARTHKLLPKCTKHMKRLTKKGMWKNYTKDQILSDALKYKSRLEWFKKSHSSYRIAKKELWFEEAVSHMPKRFIKSHEKI